MTNSTRSSAKKKYCNKCQIEELNPENERCLVCKGEYETKPTSAHTPSPWLVQSDTLVTAPLKEQNRAHYIICSCGTSGTKKEHKENARRIVYCVNMHDELLEALEEMEMAHSGGDILATLGVQKAAMDRCRCAIKNAKYAKAKA